MGGVPWRYVSVDLLAKKTVRAIVAPFLLLLLNASLFCTAGFSEPAPEFSWSKLSQF